MADALTCKIVTPTSTVFSEEATYVGLPGEAGGFGVMRGHEPFVSSLGAGVVRITTSGAKGGQVRFALAGGYAEVKDNEVIVLADNAQSLEDVDVAAVREELAATESRLAGVKDGDPDKAYYEDRKAWLDLLLKAASEQ